MRRGILGWGLLAAGTLYLMHRTWPVHQGPLPDLLWRYTPADLARFAAALSPEDRHRFVLWHGTWDLWWPLLYGGLLGVLGWRWAKPWPWARWLLLGTTVAVVAADFVENAALSVYVATFPPGSLGWARIAAWATCLKWTLLAGLLLSLALLGFRILWQALLKNRS